MGVGDLGVGEIGFGMGVRRLVLGRGPEWRPHLCGRGEGERHLSRARGGGWGGRSLGVGASLAHEATQAGAAEQRDGQHSGGSRQRTVVRLGPDAGSLEGEEDDAR